MSRPSAGLRLLRSLPAAPLVLLLVAGCRDGAELPLAPDNMDQAAPPTALAFRQLDAGTLHTCGVTIDDRAWCWGSSGGALGTGSADGSLKPVAVAGDHRFLDVHAG